MRKRLKTMLCILWFCSLLVTAALAYELPDDLSDGEYIVGEDAEAVVLGDSRATAGTDFYLYVEAAPDKPYDDGPIEKSNTALPKTGDAGISLETVLIAALSCGMGYLFCSRYAEKANC